MRGQWKRRRQGYMRADGAWFIERGAPMTGGGTAWMIMRRCTQDQIGRADSSRAYWSDGSVLWTVDADGYTEAAPSDTTDPVYWHGWDAGSLAEAKYTVAVIEDNEDPEVAACGCMIEDTPEGPRVITHSLRCPLHPENAA